MMQKTKKGNSLVPIKINIKYSLNFETNRVFDTIQKIEWYMRHRYTVFFPRALQKNRLTQGVNFTKRTIKDYVVREYKKKVYEKFAQAIRLLWKKNVHNISKEFLRYNLIPQPIYKVFLTKYGTNGSYDLPNAIIVNFRQKSPKRILNTIIHEIIHLMVESLVIKYKLNHWQKERMVDLIFKNTLPALYINQLLPRSKELAKIDNLFTSFPIDIERIFRQLKVNLIQKSLVSSQSLRENKNYISEENN